MLPDPLREPPKGLSARPLTLFDMLPNALRRAS